MFKKWLEAFKRTASFKRISSMRTKLTFSYVTLTIVPLIFISVFVFNVSFSTLKNEISLYVNNTLQQVNKNIDNSIQTLAKKLTLISINADIQRILKKPADRSIQEKIDDDDAVSEKIAEEIGDFTDIESLYVFSYNGETYRLKSTTTSLNKDYIFTSEKWFETMKKLDKTHLLLPTREQVNSISEGGRKPVVTYITRIKDSNDGKDIGVVMVELNISLFGRLIKQVSMENESKLIIIDDNKTIIYHSDPEYIASQFRSDYVGRIFEEGSGNLIVHPDGGEETLVTFNTSQKTGWTVLSLVPTDIMFKRIQSYQFALIFTILLCVLFAMVIAVLMSKNLTQPISLLRSAMKQAESGKFDTSIDVRSNDEIGELGKSYNNMIAQINGLIKRVYQTEITKKEAELNALQAQINPHFLYNTLQIMDLMAEEKDAREISESCQALSKIFRYSIRRGNETVELKDEIEHIKNYVYIQTLRLGERLKVVYDIDRRALDCEIIKLIIQPLVENAIIHGIEETTYQCTVKISGKLQGNDLIITVEDTGVGMDEKELQALLDSLYDETKEFSRKHGGIALKNVNARIKLYYSEKYGLSVKSKKNKGTRITIILPVIHHKSRE